MAIKNKLAFPIGVVCAALAVCVLIGHLQYGSRADLAQSDSEPTPRIFTIHYANRDDLEVHSGCRVYEFIPGISLKDITPSDFDTGSTQHIAAWRTHFDAEAASPTHVTSRDETCILDVSCAYHGGSPEVVELSTNDGNEPTQALLDVINWHTNVTFLFD